MPTYISAMLRILDENNVSYNNDIIKIITPLGMAGTAEYYIDTFDIDKSKEELIDLMKNYVLKAYYHTIPAKDNVIVVLKALKKRGVSLNVLTANPEIYLMVAKRLNKDVEGILFFDDNLSADKTAKSAGMRVCGVYDESYKDYTDEIKAITDYYIYNFSELLSLHID